MTYPGREARKTPPLDILKKRYASGQINKDEYNEKKANIEKA
ncbi:SHOCT domain-containing protein [Flavobacterium noncentrifugens]|nr:SHOCT domain-containing protein [Flavobacterium noncentrifugens]